MLPDKFARKLVSVSIWEMSDGFLFLCDVRYLIHSQSLTDHFQEK